jgi:cystathionine gamma-synthase
MPTIAGIPLGHSIPYLTPHAVSVSLPTWRDNVDYEEGDKRVVDAMQTGYPRFFVHRSIQKLANVAANHLEARLKDPSDSCYLYPTARTAQGAVDFLAARTPSVCAYILDWQITEATTIYCVFTDATTGFKTQKQYWQHAGDGISSRLAEDCLHALGVPINPSSPTPTSAHLSSPIMRGFSRNKHYSAKSSAALQAIMASTSTSTQEAAAEHDSANLPGQKEEETTTYIEERYARNLSASQAPLAKLALKRRIAGVLKESSLQQPGTPSTTAAQIASTDLNGAAQSIIAEPTSTNEDLQPSDRGVSGLTEDDVYLYPGGMSAIFHSFMTILHATKKSSKALGKSVCFGFPYTDTLKILEKWGPGCHFFGRGLDSDLASLEALLQTQHDKHLASPNSTDPEDQPILALYCEFPSNPLLRSPHLQKIKELQDRFGFYIVIDETVGGFINVECLPFASIVVSSLTKIFSGDSNVMGGS